MIVLKRWATSSMLGTLCATFLCSANAQQKNGWIRHTGPDASLGAIVFVHGFTGNSSETWSNGNAYWPNLLTTDPVFNGQDIFAFEYPSRKFSVSFTIDEAASDLCTTIESLKLDQYRQLTFVAHSLGGLVVRSCLLNHRKLAGRIRFLYFYATPSKGSPYAALVSVFSRNPQVFQLMPLKSENFLGSLLFRWFDARLGLHSYCAYEVQPTFGIKIVDFDSASGACTEGMQPIDANHIDIVKPKDNMDKSYELLSLAFKETAMLLPTQPAVSAKPTAVLRPVADPAVSKVLRTCYRRSLFTKTSAEQSQPAMYDSIDVCRLAVQESVPIIRDPGLRKLALNEMLVPLDSILRHRSTALDHRQPDAFLSPERAKEMAEIDALKLHVLKSFRTMAEKTGGVYLLPEKLPDGVYFDEQQASATPSVEELLKRQETSK